MSKVEYRKCDQCARSTDDSYSHIGWITMDGQVTVSYGRRPDRSADTWFARSEERDFCSTACLLIWMAPRPSTVGRAQ